MNVRDCKRITENCHEKLNAEPDDMARQSWQNIGQFGNLLALNEKDTTAMVKHVCFANC